jgi:hypothetical protein
MNKAAASRTMREWVCMVLWETILVRIWEMQADGAFVTIA